MPATITGNLKYASSVAAAIGVTLVPEETPQALGSSVVIGHNKRFVTEDDGDIPTGIQLEEGRYVTKLDNGEEFRILVPSGSGTHDIKDLFLSEDDDASPPLIGVVDPEGVVQQPPGKYYFNTANDTLWVKRTGTGKTGWQKLLG